MLDLNLIFDGTPPATGVAITTTRDSTNIIDLGALKDSGVGEEIEINVQLLATFLTLTSLQVKLQACPTVGGTYTDILLSPVIPAAQLLVGMSIFQTVLPPLTQPNAQVNANYPVLSRFIKLNYVVAGSAATAGSVFSYLTGAMDRQKSFAYPRGYAING